MKEKKRKKKVIVEKEKQFHVLGELGKKKPAMLGIISIIGMILFVASAMLSKRDLTQQSMDPELARAMTYEQFEEGSEDIEGTNNVKFSAFFLRDIDNDSNAEKIKGTAKEIGKEDTLYMELNVRTEGYLKDAKIQINSQNFYLKTNLVKDQQLKDDYISNNLKAIEFKDMTSGTQRLLSGVVRSGDYTYPSTQADAIGNNINNYSRNDNEIVLTGTYVGIDGTEKPIRKVINLTMDWYGTVSANILTSTQYYRDIKDRVDKTNKTFNLEFEIATQERNESLILSKNYVEGLIPNINGHKPIEVKGVDTYDAETGRFSIEKTSVVNQEGKVISEIPNENHYKIQVQYSWEAYQTIDVDTITLNIPISTYYEGYNNPNVEFENPVKSNVAQLTLLANYSDFPEDGEAVRVFARVDKSVYQDSATNVVSKRKPNRIYNGQSTEEKDDTYRVEWAVSTGEESANTGVVMKETRDGKPQVSDQFVKNDSSRDSMENITTNIGIGFESVNGFLQSNGWIKVYDDETGNLIATFTSNDWNKYTANQPYRFETPVRHIRVETSIANKNAWMFVYSIKELNDEYITTHYTKEEFDALAYIETTVSGYMGEQDGNIDTNQAKYEAEYATASLEIEKSTLSTQSVEKNNRITIHAKGDSRYNQVGWIDGSFLVKLPEEIVTAQINNVEINNGAIALLNYELVKKDGNYFIKINTKNQRKTQEEFIIVMDLDLVPDPRIASATKDIELYATNEAICDYQPSEEDIYDVNNNLNVTEKVMKTTCPIEFIAPNTLLTSETISHYDDKGSVVVSPEIADVKNTGLDSEERKATIGIQIRNNYTNTISEACILGKIPFEGNTYALSDEDLGSEYTTNMTNEGIQVPEELKGQVKVYYSENETPTKDVSDAENGWKTADRITDWDKVRTYLIDFGNTIMDKGIEYVFYYTIQIPNHLKLNDISYSHHGVYFSLDTENGKYRTQTEPGKVGLRIGQKYDLQLTKYQLQTDKLVSGATYRVQEVKEDKVVTEGRTAVTNAQGQLMISGLYAEKTYEIQEIKTQENYALNTDKIRYTTHINEEGNLTVEKLQGTTKKDMTVVKKDEIPNITVTVEDEVKATLKITKREKDTEKQLGFVSYQLKGKGFEEGQILSTDVNGNVSLNGLFINETYTLQETKATGYYLASPIKFKIVNHDGTYEIQMEEGEAKEKTITEENHIPTLSFVLEDEKIPTYDLEITKIGKTTHLDTSNVDTEETVNVLAGARFKLYQDKQEIGTYTTNANGQLTISGLYQYVEGKDAVTTYTLKEAIAPTGYTKIKDITFQVEEKDGKLEFQPTDDTQRKYDSDNHVVRLQIEDNPIFELVKKDGETGQVIPNVKFALFDVENNEEPARNSKGEILGTKEVIDGKEYYVLTTDANGKISADLQEGKYKAVEVKAPEKYQITNNEYYFSIGSHESDTGLKAQWAKDLSDSQTIHTVIQTSDGGYVASVNSSQNGTSGLESLYKFDEEGNQQWIVTLGSIGSYHGLMTNNLIETTEGDYICCLGDGTVAKVGSDRAPLWRKKVIENTSTYSLAKTTEGGFLLAGQNGSDGIIVICNGEGEIQNTKTIDFSSYRDVTVVKETKEGGYVVGGCFRGKVDFGSGYILESNNQTGFIVKYNQEGEVEWAKSTGTDVEKVTSIIETSNGEYVLGQYTESIGSVIKYSAMGEIQWTNSIQDGGTSRINSVVETKDGGYVVGGSFTKTFTLAENVVLSSSSSGGDGQAGTIIKYSTEGKVEWAKAVGGHDTSPQITSIIETNHGDYVVGGYRYAKSHGSDLGDDIILPSYPNSGYSDSIAMLIKFQTTEIVNPVVEERENIRKIGREIKSIAKTQDGGYLAGGCFDDNMDLGNGQTLTNHGNADGMIIKYNNKDEIEWAKEIGTSQWDGIYRVIQTQDGGYLAVGMSNENGIIIKYDSKGEIQWKDNGSTAYYSVAETKDGGYLVGGGKALIKYDNNGKEQWVKSLKSSGYANITSVIETSDGGYAVGGYFSENMDLGNGDKIYAIANQTGMIIKYDKEGNPEWNKTYPVKYDYGENAVTIKETQDGGYAVACSINSNSDFDLGNHVMFIKKKFISNADTICGLLVKYNNKGETQWAKSIQGPYSCNYINGLEETKNGELIVVGKSWDGRTELENGIVLNNYSNRSKGFAIKYDNKGETQWAKNVVQGDEDNTIYAITELEYGTYAVGGRFEGEIAKIEEKNAGIQELEVENTRKEFTITTEVEKNNDIAGGSISGEKERPYEVVKYGDCNTKEIKMTPEEGYEILKVTMNGEEISYQKAEDGSGIIPTFTNLTEDKHIVVTYALTDNKMTIHKVDEKTKQPLEGATFRIEQAGQDNSDTNLEGVLGGLNQKKIEDPDFAGIGLNRNQMHYFEKVDDTYIATNSNAYQISSTTANTIANSVLPINLTRKTGKYRVEVNAEIDSEENIGIGYATITQTGSAPSYEQIDGRFMYLTGKVEAQNYTYELEGGNMYYLHVGYKKGESDANYLDKMLIHDVSIYQPNYYFVETDGKYELNQEMGGQVSYLPIDLTKQDGNYNLKVNAQIDSEPGSDIGYAIITENEEIPNYDSEKVLMKLSGKREAKDYTTVLQGGKMYYLYLGYQKTGSTPIESETFIINSVEVKPYCAEVTTNKEGQASVEIPFGKYKIVETKAPQGYLINEEPVEIEFVAGGEKEFTIENTESAKVVVHHYLKGTKEKVAEDEIVEGKEGEAYTTAPQMDLEKYTLETDSSGRFIVPENASGRLTKENIEVNYEYVEKQIPLTVHHYLEGTKNKVPLANGQEAEDVKQAGKEGESYITHAIPENELSATYELAQIPANHTGIYTGTEMSVTYYYKKVERKVTLSKYQEDGVTPLAGAKFRITAKNETQTAQDMVYTTNAQGQIETTLGSGVYEVTEIEAPKGYALPENATTEITIDRQIQNKKLSITNEKEKGTVMVHYYIEGTKEKVPLVDGTVAQDLVITGEIGSIYATKELTNVSKKYELKAIPTNANGFIKKGTTEVIYYYKQKDEPVLQNAKLIKTSEKQTVIRADEKIPYTITYSGSLDKYKGDAIVTIVDQLPYEIEVSEEKSNLAGGIYDPKNKTITWTEKLEGINTYLEGKRQINISKVIELTYKDLDTNTEKISNKVTGEIRLLDHEDENPTDPVKPIGKTEETNEISIDIFTKVEVKLIWIDTEEEKELRPEKLILQVKKDGEVVNSKEVTITKEDNSNTAIFEKLPKYDEKGNIINYTVDEAVLPGEEHKDDLQYYKKTIEGSTITNTIDRTVDKKQGKVTVEHIDKKTGKVLKTIEKVGEIGSTYETTKEEIDGYELVEAPEEPNIVITEVEQIVKYYYERISSGILEKHMDIHTKEILYSKIHTGQKGDKYETQAKTFEGYDLATIPTNAKGEMTTDVIEVEYYYSRKTSVKVEYLEKQTGKKIAEDEKISGHENDAYTTQKKDIKGYVLVGNPANQKGKMKVTKKPDGTYETETLVQYYYTKKVLQVIEQYVNVDDNTVIKNIIHEGSIGDEYEVHPNEIDGYDLIDSLLPNNNKGIITEETTIIKYYYKKKAKVIVKYLDQLTNEELDKEEMEGYVGDSYTTKEKQWEGYDLVQTAKNATGKMTANTIEVKYYYRRKTQVEVQYLEKETNQILSESEIIHGYVGDKYKAPRKGMVCYRYVESTGNEEGFMTKDKIVVKYYFEKQEFNLRVDTWVSNVTMNGMDKGGKTLPTKDDIYKLDIHRKQVNTAEVKVTYKIRVSNIGETEGSAITITDSVPSGFSYYQEDNVLAWNKAGETLTTTELKGQTIKPGENKEIELVLRWNKGEANLKEKVNTVTLSETQSLAGFEETKQEDNVSTATMLISIATGMDDEKDKMIIITSVLGILTLILGALVYTKRNQGKE